MTKTRIALLCLVVAIVSFNIGIATGVQIRALKAKADIANLEKDYADKERVRALVVASTLEDALKKTNAETARAAQLESDLLTANAKITSQQKELSKRIASVAKNTATACPYLPFEWVQFTNDATASACPAGAGTDPASPAPSASASGAAGGGVSQGEPVIPADYLAWIRDYGNYCRQLELQNNGWRQNHKGAVK